LYMLGVLRLNKQLLNGISKAKLYTDFEELYNFC